MYCNPVFIILIKYHRVKEIQQNSSRKYVINSLFVSLSKSFSRREKVYAFTHEESSEEL